MTGWLTIGQAASRIGKSPATIYRWLRQGRIRLVHGYISEQQLLRADKQAHPGRPPRIIGPRREYPRV